MDKQLKDIRDQVRKVIPENLRAARNAMQLSFKGMAAVTGINHQRLRRLETDRYDITVAEFLIIGAVTNIKLENISNVQDLYNATKDIIPHLQEQRAKDEAEAMEKWKEEGRKVLVDGTNRYAHPTKHQDLI